MDTMFFDKKDELCKFLFVEDFIWELRFFNNLKSKFGYKVHAGYKNGYYCIHLSY